MNPNKFVEKWSQIQLKERASAQSHFEDVCRLVGHPLPADLDPDGNFFTYEYGVEKSGGGQGYADVWYDKHFAFEYKGKGKYADLSGAFQQLLQYRENLKNPPLLVVCDIENWEIHTNWPGTEKKVYKFTNADLTDPKKLSWVRWLFEEPLKLHPERNTDAVTQEAASGFQALADNMRDFNTAPERIARFLTKLIFCLFAEDIGLLPAFINSEHGIFSEIVERTWQDPVRFGQYVHDLFAAMDGGGDVLLQKIPYFNGNVFEDVNVERLTNSALRKLRDASRLNWQSIEPSIFGTLFERTLDPAKRSQLGAHYTSPEDIKLIVEPVLMQPLRREWAALLAKATPLRARYSAATTGRDKHDLSQTLLAMRDTMLKRLRTITVLDPACGSGNFLYMSLRALLDMEKEVIKAPVFAGLTDDEPLPGVHPVQLYGIEINPIAHALASIVVWIGYIQWRFENGYWQFTEPYLTRLQDNIRCMDAILAFDESGNPIEPTWPKVDVIIGNPPFLGDKKMRSELGNNYVDTLRKLYGERIPGQSDLVCYWFEKARLQIELKHCKRAGLLATNSIRGGANREVLKRIKDSGDIFMAWADREWVLDGAAVRVSMVGFDDGKEGEKMLDGIPSMSINSDLTATTDITQARNLEENEKLSFIGTQKGGPFELNAEVAMKLIASKNIKNISNEIVVKPWVNGWDITNRNRNLWIIDFGVMPLDEAQEFQAPLDYVIEHIKPDRLANSDKFSQENWWLFQRTRPEMKDAIAGKDRFICTPRVAKHRVFVWLDANVIPDSATVAIARDDDYFFGVLHSRLHEVWSLRMGTWLGKGNDPRYTPTTTFETFPFPWSPGKEPVESPEYQAIAEAARALHTEREAWLNPPEILEKSDTKLRDKLLKDRTLTNLYNALQAFRGTAEKPVKIKPVAGNFASRLHQLHTALDEAVCRAYGWPLEILNDEEAILRHLLALNLERAGA